MKGGKTTPANSNPTASDLVTETDKAVETLISTALHAAFPSYSFLGEESYTPGTRLTAAPTFVVDPIDGTTNFVHGYPYVSTSLAFVHKHEPLVGVVYNPFTGSLYHAIKGQGAFLTTALPAGAPTAEVTRRLPLRPSEALQGVDKALIAVEWGNEREGRNWEVKTGTFAALAGAQSTGGRMAHSLRSLGSAALNLCSVAAGELDSYWEGGCWAWDVAAGWTILAEAGGLIVGANKGEWEVPVDARRYLAVREAAGGEKEAKKFIEEFWSCVKGTLEYEL
jgi:myo-inositol-1(or 4)-monophosphatase